MPTVVELKQLARQRGLTGYSKLRKTELEQLLGLSTASAASASAASAASASSASEEPQVCLAKMGFFKKLTSHEGYINIFPNYRHANRKDGFGCASLSPMKLGIVEHGQSDLPAARNLENFWQQSKIFPDETEEEFHKNRVAGYLDPIPHRHKQGRHGQKPTGWRWNDRDGTVHTLDWITSRQFYCNYYERLVAGNKELGKLKDMLASGLKLQICGYDAVPFGQLTPEDAYLSTKAPFGHERVLYVMLTEKDDSQWPWRKHKTFDF